MDCICGYDFDKVEGDEKNHRRRFQDISNFVLFIFNFKSEDTGELLHLQSKYSKSLAWAENLNFPPKTVNNLFKFSAQDSDLES